KGTRLNRAGPTILPAGPANQSAFARSSQRHLQPGRNQHRDAFGRLVETTVPQMSTAPLDSLLATAHEYGASDLHLIAGVPPAFRVNGEIILAENEGLTSGDIDEMALQLITESQRDHFEREWELCVSIHHHIAGRVRVTFYKRNGHPEMSFRF